MTLRDPEAANILRFWQQPHCLHWHCMPEQPPFGMVLSPIRTERSSVSNAACGTMEASPASTHWLRREGGQRDVKRWNRPSRRCTMLTVVQGWCAPKDGERKVKHGSVPTLVRTVACQLVEYTGGTQTSCGTPEARWLLPASPLSAHANACLPCPPNSIYAAAPKLPARKRQACTRPLEPH